MEWWRKAMYPVRRVWFCVTKRLGIRKTGLLKLRQDVRSCEYRDVHVMWEMMLKRSEMELGQSPVKKKPRRGVFWKVNWPAPYLCRGY